MKYAGSISNRVKSFRLGPSVWPRVKLGSGAIVGWHAGWRLDLPHALALGQRGRVILPCPMAEPIEGLPLTLSPMLDALGVPPSRVELSLPAACLERCSIGMLLALSSLRDLGIGLAALGLRGHQLDLLTRVPLTTVVLDPSLVACLPASDEALQEVRSMVIAAQAFGLDVVAAGIESTSQRLLLTQFGIGLGEGELFAKR